MEEGLKLLSSSYWVCTLEGLVPKPCLASRPGWHWSVEPRVSSHLSLIQQFVRGRDLLPRWLCRSNAWVLLICEGTRWGAVAFPDGLGSSARAKARYPPTRLARYFWMSNALFSCTWGTAFSQPEISQSVESTPVTQWDVVERVPWVRGSVCPKTSIGPHPTPSFSSTHQPAPPYSLVLT